jgi:hypothetical protein
LTGGEAGGEEFGAAAVGTCKGNGDRVGYSRGSGSIPAVGKKRTARRRFTASRRSSGRLLAAAGGNGRGDELGLCECFHGREREASQGEERRTGKLRGIEGSL